MSEIAERCIKWMNTVVECHKELYDEGDEMLEIDKKAIEDAEYIIKCIEEVEEERYRNETYYD